MTPIPKRQLPGWHGKFLLRRDSCLLHGHISLWFPLNFGDICFGSMGLRNRDRHHHEA